MTHQDMRDRQQVSVRVTTKFAQDLNLIMASYRMTDVSQIVRDSVAAQADAIREQLVEAWSLAPKKEKED